MSIAILLCTKNGESFINEQLYSIRNQNIENIDLYILDNKSSDNTLKIVKNFSEQNKKVNVFIFDGCDLHFANSYLELAKMITNQYEYYAFCDQDDIWMKNHLSRGIKCIDNIASSKPSLFCSRTTLINEVGHLIGKSQRFLKKPSFKNALVQSIAGANTMIFNKKAFELFLMANIKKKIVSHDWLLYIFVSGSEGNIIYDQIPSVLYRQHDRNIIGTNRGIFNKAKRIYMVIRGIYNEYNMLNFYQIDGFDLLSENNKKVYKLYKESVLGKNLFKLQNLFASGVYRQSFSGQLALFLSVFIKSRR